MAPATYAVTIITGCVFSMSHERENAVFLMSTSEKGWSLPDGGDCF